MITSIIFLGCKTPFAAVYCLESALAGCYVAQEAV